MNDYIIFTDSCADLGAPMLNELGVEVLPLSFNLNGNEYSNTPDGRDMNFREFYESLRAGGTSSTSQINTTVFIEAFRPVLTQGKDVLYLAFSSGLSGTASSGMVAAETLAGEIKENKVVVVDTLAASLGQGLLVWHAAQLKKQGKPLSEVAGWVEANKLKMAHWFTVDDLKFLKRGGRLSGAAALLGTMLSIKPVLHVDNEGHLIAMEKVRGRKQSLKALLGHLEKAGVKPGEQVIFISHADCGDEAKLLADDIRERFGTKTVYLNYIGPVIGSHVGPGTMALFFLGLER